MYVLPTGQTINHMIILVLRGVPGKQRQGKDSIDTIYILIDHRIDGIGCHITLATTNAGINRIHVKDFMHPHTMH